MWGGAGGKRSSLSGGRRLRRPTASTGGGVGGAPSVGNVRARRGGYAGLNRYFGDREGIVLSVRVS